MNETLIMFLIAIASMVRGWYVYTKYKEGYRARIWGNKMSEEFAYYALVSPKKASQAQRALLLLELSLYFLIALIVLINIVGTLMK